LVEEKTIVIKAPQGPQHPHFIACWFRN